MLLPQPLLAESFIVPVGGFTSTIMVVVPVDVRSLHERGCAAHPGVTLSLDAFAAALAGRELPDDPRAADLVLAVALAAGDPGALAVLEAELVPRLRAMLCVLEREVQVVDELLQEVRVRALVPDAGSRAPRIASYSGSGSLLAWFKVMAARLRTDRFRAARSESAGGADDPDLVASGLLGPERAALQAQWGSRIEDALGTAMRALAPRDRSLLRFHYVDGLPLGKIGAMYGRDKATVSRWLARAREALLAAMTAAVGDGARPADLVSVCRQLLSRLDVSLSALHSRSE